MRRRRETIICANCDASFPQGKPSEKRKYCSQECYKAVRRAGQPQPEPRSCQQCGKSFQPTFKRRNRKFCSLECQRTSCLENTPETNAELSRRTAAVRGNTLRGRGEGKTYRKLHGRHEHRVVAEQMLGRPLTSSEVVHHRDGNKRNNDPANLEVLPSRAEHSRHHTQERWNAANREG